MVQDLEQGEEIVVEGVCQGQQQQQGELGECDWGQLGQRGGGEGPEEGEAGDLEGQAVPLEEGRGQGHPAAQLLPGLVPAVAAKKEQLSRGLVPVQLEQSPDQERGQLDQVEQADYEVGDGQGRGEGGGF